MANEKCPFCNPTYAGEAQMCEEHAEKFRLAMMRVLEKSEVEKDGSAESYDPHIDLREKMHALGLRLDVLESNFWSLKDEFYAHSHEKEEESSEQLGGGSD